MIIPARNEEDALPACLDSLMQQSEPGFALGREWELIVVDDASTDRTRNLIEEAFAARPADERVGLVLLEAPALETGIDAGFTGKTNACWAGAQHARGRLLLFTDADTIHEQGGLARARREMLKYEVALLSYSPRQLVSGVLQSALMPVVFSELARAYPMKKVNDPNDRIAAANGQFLLVTEQAYFAVGGHRGVGSQVLEDVALARAVKRGGKRGVRFRYAPDAVSARMYRSTGAMLEGWTKNLALLFNNALPLAAMRLLELLLIVGIPVIAFVYPFTYRYQVGLLMLVWVRVLWRFYARSAKSNFPAYDCALSLLGLPVFIVLLLRSFVSVKITRQVEWKGRTYPTSG